MRRITVVVVLSFIGLIYPQSESKNKFLLLSIAGGTCVNAIANTYFYDQSNDEIINPGLYFNFGVGYGPFDLVELTELYLSLTAGYTKVSTSKVQLERLPSEAQLIIETFPILFWVKFQTDTKLSPFIELGIGASRLNYIERYSWYRINTTSFNYWAFAYGLGAGLNYKISPVVEIALAADNLTNEKEHIEINNRDKKSGIKIRNSVYVYHLKVNINL